MWERKRNWRNKPIPQVENHREGPLPELSFKSRGNPRYSSGSYEKAVQEWAVKGETQKSNPSPRETAPKGRKSWGDFAHGGLRNSGYHGDDGVWEEMELEISGGFLFIGIVVCARSQSQWLWPSIFRCFCSSSSLEGGEALHGQAVQSSPPCKFFHHGSFYCSSQEFGFVGKRSEFQFLSYPSKDSACAFCEKAGHSLCKLGKLVFSLLQCSWFFVCFPCCWLHGLWCHQYECLGQPQAQFQPHGWPRFGSFSQHSSTQRWKRDQMCHIWRWRHGSFQ